MFSGLMLVILELPSVVTMKECWSEAFSPGELQWIRAALACFLFDCFVAWMGWKQNKWHGMDRLAV